MKRVSIERRFFFPNIIIFEFRQHHKIARVDSKSLTLTFVISKNKIEAII